MGEPPGEVPNTKLNQLLEQKGQPCSYCIAVFLMNENGEKLTMKDSLLYAHHLIWDHGEKPYFVQR